jgi:hypothetical protein
VLNNIDVDTIIKVKLNDEVRRAKVRRIGERSGPLVILTLDIEGEVGYCVANVSELVHA